MAGFVMMAHSQLITCKLVPFSAATADDVTVVAAAAWN
jgi:hypothetical protein